MTQANQTPFEKAAAETRDVGLVTELLGFLKATKKWWLLPIVLVIALFSLLIFLSGTGIAPLIYTLF
jgi:hypothetical protein